MVLALGEAGGNNDEGDESTKAGSKYAADACRS